MHGPELFVGTSGFSYAEWKGKFYPAELSQKKMFGYYAERFRTVEINATFYRFPTAALVEGWARDAPVGFVYALKAPQAITHKARLVGADDAQDAFAARARLLGAHQGPVLFQMPPFWRKKPEHLDALRAFCARQPRDVPAAFELRHESWLDDETFGVFREHGVALCVADSDKLRTPMVATAGFGYLRLRDEGYGELELARFLEGARAQPWQRAFVFFKHEDEARGPELAVAFEALARREA